MPLQTSPSTELYTLGRGILKMGIWSGSTPPTDPGDYVDVGVCNKFELEVTEEKLDHFSRRGGARVKDKTVTLEAGYGVSFTLDEMSVANLKMFIRASQTGYKYLHANQVQNPEYALQFQADNAFGPNEKWSFWKVRMSPAAALGLIADDWMGLQFKAEGLADTANHSSSPFFDVEYTTTTTTTTSTTTTTMTAP